MRLPVCAEECAGVTAGLRVLLSHNVHFSCISHVGGLLICPNDPSVLPQKSKVGSSFSGSRFVILAVFCLSTYTTVMLEGRLVQRLGVSQAYVSQIERRSNITSKLLERVRTLI